MRGSCGFAILLCACDASFGGVTADAPQGSGAIDAPTRAPDGALLKPDARMNPDAPAGVGEPPELTGITLAHNEARSKVGVAPLVWDPALATIASSYVAMCIDANGDGLVDHNPNRSNGYPTYVGENIYASSGTATGPAAVQLWVAEAQYYDYATNTCAAGQICGHYTQVVWAATQKLGCALHNCPGLKYPSTIVCDYGPGGNTGGRPY
ncbi:MAG TPA: CAP domain-containing protein [Kofleriaceae bacterium]|nr:CAP domain-containing protein [Kofleriaceae bacterium]